MSGLAPDFARDEYWMQRALQQAHLAREQGEVPVGAVVVADDVLISSGHNQTIMSCDPSAHAEVVALRSAAQKLNNHRLPEVTLYVTLEPCMMCAGVLVQARVQRLVYGAAEPKAGTVQSHPLLHNDWLNHQLAVTGGILSQPCGQILSEFFSAKRAQAASQQQV
ncbi:MAG: tRNA adenosine(34) deaminase TadA [Pseudomonadaceae bacterium]|nr:tRNA adenosine(34) deaminase TadA [Pseudomonadaceae bacterium]